MFQLSWYHCSDRAAPHRDYRELRSDECITVGREDGVDVLLKDKTVSRLHAEICVNGRSVRVRDRGSANGLRLDGKRVENAAWSPGQKLSVGQYTFELGLGRNGAKPDIALPSAHVHRVEGPAASPGQPGRIRLGEIFARARDNDRAALHMLFSGFLGQSEQVIDCGYLGSLGFIFPEHSFWCVTNSRVCGLLVNRAGWMSFNFGFIRSLNHARFVQPSMVMLWIVVGAWLVFWLSVAVALASAVWSLAGPLGWLLGSVLFLAVAGLAFRAIPWIVRAYYRWFKAGCVFWTRELVPIVVPSDRHSLRDAQRFIRVYTDQKRQLEA